MPKKERLVVEEQAPPEPVITKFETPPAEVAPAEPVQAPPVIQPEPPQPKPETEIETKKGIPHWLLFLIGLVIGLLLGVGVVLAWGMYSNNQSQTSGVQQPTSSEVSPTPVEAAVTPTPELDRSKLRIRVENGGGVKGAAGIGGEFLTGLGYTVVSTGNSAKNVKTTEVSLVGTKREYGQLLIDDLKEEYQVASEAGELETNGDYDALVTVAD